ncbi:D-alanyl-D-alanine carboxypeptidase [bacterium]|nr:D-alanyl-D-alanine carboxypeptidase [bacterium]
MKKIISIFMFFIFISMFVYVSFADDIDTETLDVSTEINSFTDAYTEPIKEPDVNSRACVVIDRKTNSVLFGKNENSKKKMASTTKIMTATIIIEKCNLTDTIEISKKAAGTGGSRLGLKTGDKITVLDLLYGLMLRSGNDAAVALAEYAGGDINGFAELMNAKALELGLTNTHFETPHGLDSNEHYTTAYELALLSNYALNNPTFAKIVGTKNYTITINGSPKDLSNTNELLGNMEGVYGIKTGFTNGANRCLVTACKKNNMDIICVVLGADTKKFRTIDSIKLINYVFNNFVVYDLESFVNKNFEDWKKDNLNTFIINKGLSQDVLLNIENLYISKVPIRKDLINSFEMKVECQKYFKAPVKGNSSIGNIVISNSGKEIAKCNISIMNDIDKKNSSYYFIYLLKNISSIIQKNLL